MIIRHEFYSLLGKIRFRKEKQGPYIWVPAVSSAHHAQTDGRNPPGGIRPLSQLPFLIRCVYPLSFRLGGKSRLPAHTWVNHPYTRLTVQLRDSSVSLNGSAHILGWLDHRALGMYNWRAANGSEDIHVIQGKFYPPIPMLITLLKTKIHTVEFVVQLEASQQ